MATVDIRRVYFWLLPNFPLNMQRNASRKLHRKATSTNSRNQAGPMYDIQ